MNIDPPTVDDAKEAEFLMLYHLRMAAVYFEATDEDAESRIPDVEFSSVAMHHWFQAMESLYPDD